VSPGTLSDPDSRRHQPSLQESTISAADAGLAGPTDLVIDLRDPFARTYLPDREPFTADDYSADRRSVMVVRFRTKRRVACGVCCARRCGRSGSSVGGGFGVYRSSTTPMLLNPALMR